jgi:hypothetical protein
VAQLTEWRGDQYTFTIFGEQSLQLQQTYNFHLRADVRKWRRVIHKAPDEPEGGVFSTDDSTGTFQATGSAQKNCPGDGL